MSHTTPLCFREAAWAWKQGSIAAEEYFETFTAHLQGIRHEEDAIDDVANLRIIDPVAACFKRLVLDGHGVEILDSQWSSYQHLLLLTHRGDLEEVKSSLALILSPTTRPLLIQPLAILAAANGHHPILFWLYANGASWHDKILDTAIFSALSPSMLHPLYEADWRGIKSSKEACDDLLVTCVGKSEALVSTLLALGASVSGETFRRAALLPPSGADIGTMSLLVTAGHDVLKPSRVLEVAASRGRCDILRYMLENVKDTERNGPLWLPHDGEVTRAIYEAIVAEHVQAVRFLLDHGARRDTALAAAKAGRNEELVKLIESYGDEPV